MPRKFASAAIPVELLTWADVTAQGDTILTAGELHSWRIDVNLQRPLPSGTRVEVWVHMISDFGDAQNQNATDPGYVFIQGVEAESETFAADKTNNHYDGTFPYRRTVRFSLKQAVDAGQGFSILFDRVRAQSYEERYFNLRLALYDSAGELFGYLGDAGFQVVGGKPTLFYAVAPTVLRPGETATARFLARDRLCNHSTTPLSELAPSVESADPGLEILDVTVDDKSNTGRVRFRANQEGVYYPVVTSGNGNIRGEFNPVVVDTNATERVYWGDLHQHTYYADGRGTPSENLAYGRDIALLDFGGLSPHIDTYPPSPRIGLAAPAYESMWDDILEACRKAGRKNNFVAFAGYELGFMRRFAGDHNIYYRGLDKTSAPPPPPTLLGGDSLTSYAKFKDALNSLDTPALSIPHLHAGGGPRMFDGIEPVPEKQRLIEIGSGHGLFEQTCFDWLNAGHRLGLIACGDTHTTNMGNARSGGYMAASNGLAAVRTPKLDRNNLWDSMMERNTYATTGNQRIYLDFSLGGNRMGSTAKPGRRDVQVMTAGTSPILRIDLIRNGEIAETWQPPSPVAPAGLLRVAVDDTTLHRWAMENRSETWIQADSGELRLVAAHQLFSAKDRIEQRDGQVYLHAVKYCGMQRVALLEPPRDASRLQLKHTEQVDGKQMLNESAVVDLEKTESRFEWPLPIEGNQAGLHPQSRIRIQRVDPEWEKVVRNDWTIDTETGEYWLVRVEQINGDIAWSSPVWIN